MWQAIIRAITGLFAVPLPAEWPQLLATPPLALALYQFPACPYCGRVLETIRELGLAVELRDTRAEPRWEAELLTLGGRNQVPCLRINLPDEQTFWLYESSHIIAYLQHQVSNQEQA